LHAVSITALSAFLLLVSDVFREEEDMEGKVCLPADTWSCHLDVSPAEIFNRKNEPKHSNVLAENGRALVVMHYEGFPGPDFMGPVCSCSAHVE
jgi:hypothetical protein